MRAVLIVAACLVLAASPVRGGPVVASIHWKKPLHEFPTLGFRTPVDMAASGWSVDRLLADLPEDAFNCHYYTKTFIEGREPAERARDANGQEMLSDLYLLRHGFRRTTSLRAGVGDIVTALRPSQSFREATYISHSGIVTETGEGGEIVAIRQKFAPGQPVVDLSLGDFIAAYAGKHPWRAVVWTRLPATSALTGQE
jgi:hypothetical protein